MRGADTFTESLFTMRHLDDFVPADHPLRVIRVMVNKALTHMDELFARMYAADIKGGRPSIAPEKLLRAMLLYQTVAEHYETWLELASAGQFDGQCDHHTPKPFVRKAFATYLECGIFAHGFARARCEDCGHDYFVAFSCKGRGVCPSCTTRRMVETAAHLSDHVFPRLPVRQWVLSVPKRLRYFMQRDGPVLNMVLRAVRISTGSANPLARHWRSRLMPSPSGRPKSSTQASNWRLAHWRADRGAAA